MLLLILTLILILIFGPTYTLTHTHTLIYTHSHTHTYTHAYICNHKYSVISDYTHSHIRIFIFFIQSELKNQRSSDARPAAAGYNYDPIDVKIARKKLLVRRLRSIIISTGKRSDGRGVEDVRPITIDTSLLPGAHGSSLFTRGETQSLSTATLGKDKDQEMKK